MWGNRAHPGAHIHQLLADLLYHWWHVAPLCECGAASPVGACEIAIDGACARYPEISGGGWFTDAAHGGPTGAMSSAGCAARAASWTADCGVAVRHRVAPAATEVVPLPPTAPTLCDAATLARFDTCPGGPRAHYLATNHSLVGVAAQTGSGWRLLEDRDGRFGWILDVPSGDARHDTVSFPIVFGGGIKRLTVSYLETYLNAGRVEVSVDQPAELQKAWRKNVRYDRDAAASGAARPGESSRNLIPGGTPLVIDAFAANTSRFAAHSMYRIEIFLADGFAPGPANVSFRLLPEHPNELARRGGNRFKLSSLSSC